MVNYTARVQHAWGGSFVIFSDIAKREFESEYGSAQTDVRFLARQVDMKGFKGKQVVWLAETQAMRAARRNRARAQRGELPPS
jgi:hypothetical protein